MSVAEASSADSASHNENGLQRRNSIERYRPGALFSEDREKQREEREKARQRGHFGEKRLNLDINKANGHRGRGRGRGGGRGRGRNNFNNYRNGNSQFHDDDDTDEDNDGNDDDYNQELKLQASPPPLGNWADQLSDVSPDTSPVKTEPQVRDLRDKLNSMRMNGSGDHQQQQQYHHHQQQQQQQQQQQPRQQRNKFSVVQGRGGKPGRPDRNDRNNDRNHQGGHGRPDRNQQVQNAHRLPLVTTGNTKNFNPSHEPAQMRILAAPPNLRKYNRPYQSRDVVMVSDLFGDPNDLTTYNNLLYEIQNCGVEKHRLWQSWHNDSHVIADDKVGNWKDKCPTFTAVVTKMAEYFDMDVQATRFNWYRDSSEWKPFHHDAAAIKEKFARTQNFTLAASFGAERDAAFEHAKTKTTISMPQPNGSIYTFGRDVNILWRHGIPQLPPEKQSQEGRISIIAWGWIPNMEDV